jgi:hypothetical protein
MRQHPTFIFIVFVTLIKPTLLRCANTKK